MRSVAKRENKEKRKKYRKNNKAIIPANAIGVVVSRMPETARCLYCTSESLSKKRRKTYSSQ